MNSERKMPLIWAVSGTAVGSGVSVGMAVSVGVISGSRVFVAGGTGVRVGGGGMGVVVGGVVGVIVRVGGWGVGVAMSSILSGESAGEQAFMSNPIKISIYTDGERGMEYVKNFGISTVVRYRLKR